MNQSDSPHRRWNPLRREWVLVSPHRTDRPWQGATEGVAPETRVAHDPACYLCPGNKRNQGAVNPPYTGVFAFSNDFPSLLDAPALCEEREMVGGISKRAEVSGECRVVCFSPRHDITLPELSEPELLAVLQALQDETERLKRNPSIRHAMIFENKGAAMGCSNPHPHCQIWATSYVPNIPAQEYEAQSGYKSAHGKALLVEYAEREREQGDRVVFANDHWTALVPYWATWPFETMLIPRREIGEISQLSKQERAAWAAAFSALTIRYDNLFSTSFPYSMGLYQRPFNMPDSEGFVLHHKFFPPLLRSAAVRKFMVGFELCAEAQRDITAETAAQRLREVSAKHYRTAPR